VAWTAPGADGTKILSARSVDGARSFSRAQVVPGGEARGNRGWESLVVDPKGRVLTLWLDHRNTQSTMSHQHGEAAPVAKADPVARAALSQLFFASIDAS